MSQNAVELDEPFTNHSIPESQPERLATIALLRGMQPRDLERSRVLELACGSGQNLIPLAERYPESTFVGLDASERQIARARETVAGLNLANIDFRQRNLVDAGPELGEFDYIIAHAVYSRVDEPSRDRLLALCQRHLAPQGVAYVSYSVYPGWHVYDMFRAMMLYESRGATEPAERANRARMLLEFLKDSLTSPDAPYDATIRAELEPLLNQTDAHLRRELLGEISYPVYFRRFIAHARSHGLQYLGDCTQGIRYADTLQPQIEQDLQGVTSDPIEQIQYRDVLQKKSYRQTLLCRSDIPVLPSPTPQAFEGLYLEAPIRREHPQMPLNSMQMERFFGPGDSSVGTAAPLIKAALVQLGEIWPQSIRFADLVAAARLRIERLSNPPATISPAELGGLQNSLVQCCTAGIVDVHTEAHCFTTTISQRPAASSWARWQAARGPIVTNRRHVTISIDELDRHVLLLLDGTRDHAQLVDQLVQWAIEGRIQLRADQQTVVDPARIRQAMQSFLPQVLARLAQNALLVS